MTILGCSQSSIKSDWKLIVGELRKNENPYITMKEMLELCAEKDQPLRNLLLIPELTKSINRMKSMSQIVYEFYHEFIERFSKKLPHVFSMISNEIKEKVNDLAQNLKIAILEADVQKMIWVYKNLVSKIDYLKMKEMGFIPFDYKADTDVIMCLSQYINKAEDVSFALFSL